MSSVYRGFGVDIEAGDDFSKFAGAVCAKSYNNSPFVEVLDLSSGHFRGPKGWRFKNLPEDCIFDGAPDGVGTKVILIDAAGAHETAARDILAMTAGDITRFGGMPLVFCNVLDVKTLGRPDSATRQAYQKLMLGLGAAAKEQRIVLYRGETAELRDCVTSENKDGATQFNWAGFMVGVTKQDRIITGETLRHGQIVVALQEASCRSNDISAVRGALRTRFGKKWWDNEEAKACIRQAALPSTLYDRFLAIMNGWDNEVGKPRVKMHLIAHISGGGIVDKFGYDTLFRYGFGAELYDLFPPPAILKKAVEWTNMEETEAYKTFSSGNGALVVLDETDVPIFVDTARTFGLKARACGTIEAPSAPYLRINSGYSDKTLEFCPD